MTWFEKVFGDTLEIQWDDESPHAKLRADFFDYQLLSICYYYTDYSSVSGILVIVTGHDGIILLF